MPEAEPTCPPDQTKPWQSATDALWAARVNEWTWIQDPQNSDYWAKEGPCQRCGHPMSVDYDGAMFASLSERQRPTTILRFCNCELPQCHAEGRPKDEPRGCGQGDYVTGPLG